MSSHRGRGHPGAGVPDDGGAPVEAGRAARAVTLAPAAAVEYYLSRAAGAARSRRAKRVVGGASRRSEPGLPSYGAVGRFGRAREGARAGGKQGWGGGGDATPSMVSASGKVVLTAGIPRPTLPHRSVGVGGERPVRDGSASYVSRWSVGAGARLRGRTSAALRHLRVLPRDELPAWNGGTAQPSNTLARRSPRSYLCLTRDRVGTGMVGYERGPPSQ